MWRRKGGERGGRPRGREGESARTQTPRECVAVWHLQIATLQLHTVSGLAPSTPAPLSWLHPDRSPMCVPDAAVSINAPTHPSHRASSSLTHALPALRPLHQDLISHLPIDSLFIKTKASPKLRHPHLDSASAQPRSTRSPSTRASIPERYAETPPPQLYRAGWICVGSEQFWTQLYRQYSIHHARGYPQSSNPNSCAR